MRLLPFLLVVRCIAALPAMKIDPIPRPTIGNLTYSGNACPQRTVSSSLSLGNTATGSYQLSSELTSFTPLVSGGISGVADLSRNCQLHLDISVPSGWAVRINNGGSDVRGYIMLLDDKTTGSWRATYTFEGHPPSSSSSLSFTGPIDERFLKHSDAQSPGISSACGGGKLDVAMRIGMSTTNTKWPQYPGPEEDEMRWVIVTGVEVLQC